MTKKVILLGGPKSEEVYELSDYFLQTKQELLALHRIYDRYINDFGKE